MSLDDLKIEVSKLSPKAGDLLILKHPNQLTWQARMEMQRSISDVISWLDMDNPPPFVMLPDGYDLMQMSEQDLASVSLCRIDSPAVVEGKS
jgi:hypothetical protein